MTKPNYKELAKARKENKTDGKPLYKMLDDILSKRLGVNNSDLAEIDPMPTTISYAVKTKR